MARAARTRESWLLGATLAVALAVRLLYWWSQVEALENEGVVYARLAQNLFDGVGYVGIFGGRDVMFPPMFPILIGVTSLATGDTELAGRLISLACGVGLVAALYGIARCIFDVRTAVVTATLAAVHPLLVALSVTAYSEGTWLLLVVGATYAVLRSRATGRVRWLVVAGAATGMAYLVRPEAILFVGYLALAVLAGRWLDARRAAPALAASIVFLATSLLFVLPYVLYLSSLAGAFRWEGKSVYNNRLNEQMRAGATIQRATRGLDAAGNPTGVALELHLDQAPTLRLASGSSSHLLASVAADPLPRVKRVVRSVIGARFLSAPWLFLAVAAGVVLAPWWRARGWEGSTLLGASLVQGLALLAADFAWSRYFFVVLPFLLIWAGAGLERVAAVVAARLGASGRGHRFVANGGVALGGLALTVVAMPSVWQLGEFWESRDRTGREIGEWIAADARRRVDAVKKPIVMGNGLRPAYYADATMRYLPHADEAAALVYVRRVGPQYLVVRSHETHQAPYFASWLDRGISDACAELGNERWSKLDERSRVWRWTCAPESTAR